MLRRIMAMLLAFAVLAERAAGRSFPVRWLVLTILRSGEFVACAWVAEVTQCEWQCEDPAELGFEPGDAILLAARFRMLAALLVALLLPARVVPGRSRCIAGTQCRFAPRAGRLAVVPAGLPRGPFDTS